MKLPYGHGVLVGIEGSGITELTRLAVFLCNFEIYEVSYLLKILDQTRSQLHY
jgi:hypothetical protein